VDRSQSSAAALNRGTERENHTFRREFRDVFDARYTSLFRYVHRLVADQELAADITQEAFVKLYQRGGIPVDVRAWLGTVATNLVRDEQRMRQRRAAIVARAEPAPQAYESPEGILLQKERQAGVRAALDTLPPRSREILLLRHEGFSYREIARVAGVAEASVGTLLARATSAFTAAYGGRSDERV